MNLKTKVLKSHFEVCSLCKALYILVNFESFFIHVQCKAQARFAQVSFSVIFLCAVLLEWALFLWLSMVCLPCWTFDNLNASRCPYSMNFIWITQYIWDKTKGGKMIQNRKVDTKWTSGCLESVSDVFSRASAEALLWASAIARSLSVKVEHCTQGGYLPIELHTSSFQHCIIYWHQTDRPSLFQWGILLLPMTKMLQSIKK